MVEPASSPDQPQPPTLGLAVAADLWLWGALVLLAPSYLGIAGWNWAFNIVGLAMVVISFAGALLEIGKLRKSEGLKYWATSLVFLLPAVVLALYVHLSALTGPAAGAAKLSTLLLIALGGALFIQGVPFLLWNKGGSSTTEHDAVSPTGPRRTRGTWKLAASALVAMLSLVTALLGLAEALID